MKDIFNSHPVSVLKKEISKTNIKGYSKMKKAQVVDLMMENKSRFSHIKMADKSVKKKIIKKTPSPKGPSPSPKKPSPSPKSLSPSPKKGKLTKEEAEELKNLFRQNTGGWSWDKDRFIELQKKAGLYTSPKKSPSPSPNRELEKVDVKFYLKGTNPQGRGSDVFIDNKTGKVYNNKTDKKEAGYIITISRGRGQSPMKGILINGDMFGKDFDLSYPFEYNYVNFKSYKLKKFGFKDIPDGTKSKRDAIRRFNNLSPSPKKSPSPSPKGPKKGDSIKIIGKGINSIDRKEPLIISDINESVNGGLVIEIDFVEKNDNEFIGETKPKHLEKTKTGWKVNSKFVTNRDTGFWTGSGK